MNNALVQRSPKATLLILCLLCTLLGLAEMILLSEQYNGINLFSALWWDRFLKPLNFFSESLGFRRFFIAFSVGAILFGLPISISKKTPITTKFRWLPACFHTVFFVGLWLLTDYLIRHTDPSGLRNLLWLSVLFSCHLLLWASFFRLKPIWFRISPYLKNFGIGLLFGIATILLGYLAQLLWLPLSNGTFFLVSKILSQIYPDIHSIAAAKSLGRKTFYIHIHPFCSGYEGIGLFWSFLGCYLYAFRKQFRFPHAMWLLPLGTALIFIGNSIRISLLYVIGTEISKTVASQGFHQQAGWILFVGISLSVATLAHKIPFFAKKKEKQKNSVGQFPLLEDRIAPALLLPLLILIAVSMATGAFLSGEVQWFFPVRVIIVISCLCYFWRDYAKILSIRLRWEPVLAGLVGFVLWINFANYSNSTAKEINEVFRHLSHFWAVAWLVFRLIGYGLIAPIVEELAFRVYMIPKIESFLAGKQSKSLASLIACLASSALFAAFHDGFLLVFTVGCIYALSYLRRRQAMDPILAHATTNFCLILHCLIEKDWGLLS